MNNKRELEITKCRQRQVLCNIDTQLTRKKEKKYHELFSFYGLTSIPIFYSPTNRVFFFIIILLEAFIINKHPYTYKKKFTCNKSSKFIY